MSEVGQNSKQDTGLLKQLMFIAQKRVHNISSSVFRYEISLIILWYHIRFHQAFSKIRSDRITFCTSFRSSFQSSFCLSFRSSYCASFCASICLSFCKFWWQRSIKCKGKKYCKDCGGVVQLGSNCVLGQSLLVSFLFSSFSVNGHREKSVFLSI